MQKIVVCSVYLVGRERAGVLFDIQELVCSEGLNL